jgi:hypothetical protein
LDALPQCKFDFFYDHRDNEKELSAKPYRGCSFDGPKEPKAPGRNNHPADSIGPTILQGRQALRPGCIAKKRQKSKAGLED